MMYHAYSISDSTIPGQVKLQQGDTIRLRSNNILQIESELGVGGFGTVYKVNENSGQSYAIKVLDLWKKKPDEWQSLKKRFEQGFKACNLKSPNLVQSIDYGVISGNPFIIMEYCNNGNLTKRMSEFSSESDYNYIGSQILMGLDSLHYNGVIHRDIKPDNVLFDHHDVPKLTDFDISIIQDRRETLTNWLGMAKEVWGTAVYAPPEQLDFKKAVQMTTTSSDIFAFGVTMFETITQGHFPFGGFEDYARDPMQFYKKVKSGQHVPLRYYKSNAPARWEYIIQSCIHPDPKLRPKSVREILNQIGAVHSGLKLKKEELLNEPVTQLQILNGSESKRIFALNQIIAAKENNILRIGWQDKAKRNKSNDIGIQEEFTKFVSSAHATMEYERKNWYIRDGQWVNNKEWKNSTNGTYVNGEKLEEGERKIVMKDDIIMLGETTLKAI